MPVRTLRAMPGQILARKLTDKHNDQGGIAIPESEWTRIKRGVVVSSASNNDIVAGDIVALPAAAGDEFWWGDEDTIIRVRGDAVLGLLADEKTTPLDGEAFVDKFVPVGDNMVVRPCRTTDIDAKGKPIVKLPNGKVLEVPDSYANWCDFVEIMVHSMRCNPMWRPGMTVWLSREFSKDLWCLDYRRWEYWVASEKLIPALTWTTDVPTPLDDMVVAKMDCVTEEKGFALDDDTKAYNREWSQDGVIVAVGERSCVKKYVGNRVKMARDCYHFETDDGVVYACGRDKKIEGIYV